LYYRLYNSVETTEQQCVCSRQGSTPAGGGVRCQQRDIAGSR
jgi:hypothetical protein